MRNMSDSECSTYVTSRYVRQSFGTVSVNAVLAKLVNVMGDWLEPLPDTSTTARSPLVMLIGREKLRLVIPKGISIRIGAATEIVGGIVPIRMNQQMNHEKLLIWCWSHLVL